MLPIYGVRYALAGKQQTLCESAHQKLVKKLANGSAQHELN